MKIQFFICLLSFLISTWCLPKRNLTCLTGFKILTRHSFTTIQNLTKYKLQQRCLCPNNYYGQECESHIGIDCYLNPLNQLDEINSSNVKQQMPYTIELSTDCYVMNKSSPLMGKIQLRQFLSKNNEKNSFGVRQQFGANTQIIWANDTQLFNADGQLIAQKKSPQLSKQERANIIMGNNQKLHDTPFVYRQHFIKYGLINGNISFLVDVINPQYGTIKLANFSQQQVLFSWVQEYVQSYTDMSQMNEKRQSFINSIRDMFKNGTLNQTVQKYVNGSQRPKDFSDVFNRSDININPQQLQIKPLPTIKIPFKINPYNSTFYQTIRIQVSIRQKYQQIVTHQTSLNSAQWLIPVNVTGLGLPEPTSKILIVTDSSYKSYYKILAVVAIVGIIYFALTYGYKRYKKWKNQQYTQFEDDKSANVGVQKRRDSEGKKLQQQSVRSTTTQSTQKHYR